MKLLILTLFGLFFFFVSEAAAQTTPTIEQTEAERKQIFSDSLAKMLLKPNPNHVYKKPKPEKITDTKKDNRDKKEFCECLGLVYTVSFNGYFLGCF